MTNNILPSPTETKSNQIQHEQDLVIVFVTQECSKEQREDLVGNVYNCQRQD